jgi:hypothetical protein
VFEDPSASGMAERTTRVEVSDARRSTRCQTPRDRLGAAASFPDRKAVTRSWLAFAKNHRRTSRRRVQVSRVEGSNTS